MGKLVGKYGKVYGFEVDKTSFSILTKNILLNDLEDQYKFFNVGVHSGYKTMTFAVNTDNTGGSSILNIEEQVKMFSNSP
jgi:tRNA G37 N-methylase Trm5